VTINYRDYVSRASAFIGLDITQAAMAYAQLARDPALRQRMGQAGQQRARRDYDWVQLIPRYTALFTELARVRQQAEKVGHWHTHGQHHDPQWGHRHPRRSDPFHSFSHYPTHTLSGTLTLLPGPLLPTDPKAREKALAQQLERPVYAGIKKELDKAQLQQLLHQVAQAPQGLAWSSWSTFDAETPPVLRHLGWLIKTGLVRVA